MYQCHSVHQFYLCIYTIFVHVLNTSSYISLKYKQKSVNRNSFPGIRDIMSAFPRRTLIIPPGRCIPPYLLLYERTCIYVVTFSFAVDRYGNALSLRLHYRSMLRMIMLGMYRNSIQCPVLIYVISASFMTPIMCCSFYSYIYTNGNWRKWALKDMGHMERYAVTIGQLRIQASFWTDKHPKQKRK